MQTSSQGKAFQFHFLAVPFAVLLLSLLVACSDGLLLSETDATARVAYVPVTELAAGQIQKADTPLILKLEGVEASNWTVSIVSSAQDPLWQKTFHITDKTEPTITPKDWESILQNKKVTPRLTLQGQATAADRKPAEFHVPFYLFRNVPVLTISTVPVEVEPEAWLGSQAFLSDSSGLALEPTGWIVWKVGGQALASGSFAEKSLLWWKADSKPGTSEMEASWYPEVPSTDPLDSAPPPVVVVSLPVVTSTPRPISGELVPEESYSALWHFRGTLNDRTGKSSLADSGKTSTSWALLNGMVAAWLSVDSRLSGKGLEFLKDGLRPFTLNLAFKPSETAQETILWQTLDSNGETLLELALKAGGKPTFRAYSAPKVYQELEAGVMLTPDFTTLSLSAFPSDKDWSLVWYQNGTRTASGKLTQVKGLPTGPGGSSQRWAGPVWWDEAGFYTKTPKGVASTDPDVFERALEQKFGTDLVLAQGFDGMATPAG